MINATSVARVTGRGPVAVSNFVVALGAALALGAPLALAQKAGTPLPTDQRLVTGELSNGLSYKVLKHANPPGRAALYIHVSTGSLNETDSIRGISHYLEHMAFNGSKNFPPGTVIDFFQSLGLTFGQHQNAFTSFDQTTYLLELPDNKPETLDKGLMFFSDVAGRLSLSVDEIEKERQVIMREKQSRLGAQQRVQEYVLERLAPGSTIGKRLPIGTEETILGVKEADFRQYYESWYVPSNMTVMVVADSDPKEVVSRIETHFASLGAGQRAPRPHDLPVGVKADVAPRAIVATDKELTRASVGIQRIAPPRPATTTVEQLREEMVRQAGMEAFNRRIEEKVNAGKMSFLSGGAGVQSLFNTIDIAGAQASCEPEKWRASMEELATELKRAIAHGFTKEELDDVEREYVAGLEQAVATEATRNARAILGGWNNDVASGEPIMSASQRLEVMKPLIATISPAEVSSAFASSFAPHLVFSVSLPTSVAAPSEAELVDLGMKAMSATVAAEAKAAKAAALMESPPKPGTVAEQGVHEASGVWSAWLGNNIRAHHRFMDYKKNQVTVAITLFAGEIAESDTTRGITQAAMNAWSRPATSTLSSTNIRDLTTGKKVEVGGGVSGADQLRLTITGNPEDLETGFQLAHLLLTDPKIEDAAFTQWRTSTLQAIAQQDKNPQAYFQKLVADTIFPAGEVRTRPLTKAQVEALDAAKAQAWLKAIIAKAPIEVAIVGDLPRERAVELAQRYLASLPTREKVSPSTNEKLRALAKPKQTRTASVEMETETPMAMALGGFFGPDERDLTTVRRLRLASSVVTTRMINTLRENEQLVYGIRANVAPGTAFPGWGLVIAAAPTQPDKADKLIVRIHEMFAEFAKGGPTEEEVTTAKKQIANTLDEQMKEPSFWINACDQLTYDDKKIDDVLNAPAAYQAISAEEIKSAFAAFYTPDSQVSIVVKPKAKPDAPKADDKNAKGPTG